MRVGALTATAKRGWVVATSVVLGVLAVWGCIANVSIARDYQLGREQVTTFRDPGSLTAGRPDRHAQAVGASGSTQSGDERPADEQLRRVERRR